MQHKVNGVFIDKIQWNYLSVKTVAANNNNEFNKTINNDK